MKVNPRQAKRFGEALGVRAKTDRADAAMLARMGAALALEPLPVRPDYLCDLNELVVARRALIKDRTAARNRAQGLSLPLLRRQTAARWLWRIEAELAVIDREIAARILACPALKARRDILTSIPGVSVITAGALITMAPEHGALDARQAGKLAGLAPIIRQSGTWRGQAFIRGGHAELRQALYMPALIAMRHDPDLARFADRLRDRGKLLKVIITAVMRELFITANALMREKRAWMPENSLTQHG